MNENYANEQRNVLYIFVLMYHGFISPPFFLMKGGLDEKGGLPKGDLGPWMKPCVFC